MKKLLFLAAILVACTSLTFGQNSIDNAFFDHVNYVGAFGDDDWTSPWAEWDPDGAAYPAFTQTIPFTNINSGETVRFSSGVSPALGAADFSNPRLQDPWWTPVTYVGAFDGTNDWTSPWANFDPQNTVYAPTTVTVNAGEITGNVTWVNTEVYKLNGFLYVRDGATLTIEAGTLIRGDKTNKGTIIVERGGKLIAQGTPTQPIVFTSNQAAGSRDAGDWGGIILLGRAAINEVGGVATIEGGVGSLYGGGTNPDNNDDSGILEYVRIEFPGIAFQPNDEINGLTLGGVGKGTSVNYVQVSFSGDDSFEWFGGTVDAKYLIAFKGLDDDLDTDKGFTGRVQFAVVLRDPAIADVSGSRGWEADGKQDGTVQPFASQSRPLYSNISVFGAYPELTSPILNSDHDVAMKLREATECSIYNSFVAGWRFGLEISDTETENNATAGLLQLQNVYIAGSREKPFEDSPGGPFDENFFLTPSFDNAVFTTNASLRIIDPFNLTNPNFQPDNNPTVYKLDGRVYVNDGATLIIDPGTIFRCTQNGEIGETNGSAIIVQRGGKIFAEGTAQKPIVFTSSNTAGNRNPGDWAGIIVCGNATINQPTGEAVIEGGTGVIYGGGATPDDSESSGVIKYVRIEFAGFTFAPNDEINGLTMGGVGNGTTLDFIQISFGNDDSFEWFGGTVNAKHLISYRTDDDDFDGDQGWNGMVQYAVALRDPGFNGSGANGFEISNDGTGTPITHPIFSNVNIVIDPAHTGTKYDDAIQLKDNTEFELWNGLTIGHPTGLDFVGAGVVANAGANLIKIQSTFLSDHPGGFYEGSDGEQAYFEATSRDNDTYAAYTTLNLIDPLNLSGPDFRPQANSPVRHRSYWTREVTGTVTYDNAANDPLENVVVAVNDGSKGVVFTATTNAAGEFTFPRLGEGNYTLTASTAAAWNPLPPAVSGLDAQQAQAHFLGNLTLTGIRFLAGDVDESGVISATDAFNISKRIANNPVPAWSADDWIFSTESITVGASNVTQDLKGIQSGDVNGSYTPAK